jgi:glycosyltransferase involved in cell wall biosynthesis
MAAGKAVVATDLPGIRDALGPRAGEVVAPPGDAETYAAKILELLVNRERRLELGEANRVRARTEFTVGRMADRYLRVIQTNLPAEAS